MSVQIFSIASLVSYKKIYMDYLYNELRLIFDAIFLPGEASDKNAYNSMTALIDAVILLSVT